MIATSQPYSYNQLGQRSNQEDALWAEPSGRCLVVCDGVGGNDHGEVASRLVCDIMERHFSALAGRFTMQLFTDAMQDVFLTLESRHDQYPAMSTTMAFVAFAESEAFVAHVGDSRVYQMRPGQGTVFCTRDHSMVAELVELGLIKPEEAATHPHKNVITRALHTMRDDDGRYTPLTIDHVTDVRQGDIFLLCTDGVSDMLTPALIDTLLSSVPLDERMRLLAQATAKSADNNTAVCVEILQASTHASESLTQELALSPPPPPREKGSMAALFRQVSRWFHQKR